MEMPAMMPWCWCRQWCIDTDSGSDIVMLMLATVPWHECNDANDSVMPVPAMTLWYWCWQQWCNVDVSSQQRHCDSDASNNTDVSTEKPMLVVILMQAVAQKLTPWCQYQQQCQCCSGTDTGNDVMMLMLATSLWCWCQKWHCDTSRDVMTLTLTMMLWSQC